MKKFFPILFLLMPAFAQASWFGERPLSFAELVDRVKPAVVNISTTKTVKRPGLRLPPSPFGGTDPFDEFRRFFEDESPREEKQQSLGSGCIINKEGDILTNNHVIGEADEIIVKLLDGRKFKASVVGRDERTDLAVIKIKSGDSLPFAVMGDSDAARQGDWAMAVGNPFGFEHTVTVGVISAKGRIIGDAKAPYARFIQTDASINPGNSGGPLFNTRGEVIGINTMIYGMGTGIGFAIPINLAKSLVPQLISKGAVTRGWLGVQIQRLTPELAESYGLKDEKGALIGGVFPGSPAEQAGLQRGDIVLKFNGKVIEEPFDLSDFVAQAPAGSKMELEVLRKGKEKLNIAVKVGQRESEEKLAGLGEEKKEEGQVGTDVLGLHVRDLSPAESSRYGGSKTGVVIDRVEPGSSAEYNDLREGDLLIELNDAPVANAAAYQKAAAALKKGSLVRLLVSRGQMTLFVAFRI